jgi:hypothetical protein
MEDGGCRLFQNVSNFSNYNSEDHNSDTVERVEISRIFILFLGGTIVEYAV